MINYICDAVTSACATGLGASIEFKRDEGKSKPFAPFFHVYANGQPTKLAFNTEIINDPKFPISLIVPKIIEGLIIKLAEELKPA